MIVFFFQDFLQFKGHTEPHNFIASALYFIVSHVLSVLDADWVVTHKIIALERLT